MSLIAISGKLGSGKDTVAKIIQFLTKPKGSNEFTLEDYLNKEQPIVELFRGNNWKNKKFADKLKDIVCLLIGCTRAQLEDQEFKNKPLPVEWQTEGKPVMTPRLMLQLIGTEGGRDLIHENIWVNATFADYLPHFESKIGIYKIGDKWIREEHLHKISDDDSDVDRLFIKKETEENFDLVYPNWLITDMRFPNEMSAIKERNGLTLRVTRHIYKYLPETDEHQWSNSEDIWQGFAVRCKAQTYTKESSYSVWMRALNEHTGILEHPSENAIDEAEFDYIIDNSGTIDELVEKVRDILIKENLIEGYLEFENLN